MKIIRPVFAALLLVGMMRDYNAAFAADGIILKEEVTLGSYCHLKFPAIREDTLVRDQPVLKVPNETLSTSMRRGSCCRRPST